MFVKYVRPGLRRTQQDILFTALMLVLTMGCGLILGLIVYKLGLMN